MTMERSEVGVSAIFLFFFVLFVAKFMFSGDMAEFVSQKKKK